MDPNKASNAGFKVVQIWSLSLTKKESKLNRDLESELDRDLEPSWAEVGWRGEAT